MRVFQKIRHTIEKITPTEEIASFVPSRLIHRYKCANFRALDGIRTLKTKIINAQTKATGERSSILPNVRLG